jgi:hypothetical protein
MPFGPINGPATFINFIHGVDSRWKALAKLLGVVINDNTNTKIIVDDISAGLQPWAWLYCIWNTKCESVNPTNYH